MVFRKAGSQLKMNKNKNVILLKISFLYQMFFVASVKSLGNS